MQPLELYIHIPFCVKICAYCDFLSGPAGEKEKEEYVKMLVDEIRNCPDTVQNYRVISIFSEAEPHLFLPVSRLGG